MTPIEKVGKKIRAILFERKYNLRRGFKRKKYG
jgi:hypothetical protein